MFDYKVYYEDTCIFEDKGWKSIEDAEKDAKLFVESQVEYREADNVPCNRALFSIVITPSQPVMVM